MHNWTDAWNMQKLHPGRRVGTAGISSARPIMGLAVVGAIAAAMVGSIFSSDAWNNVTFIAGEMKNPKTEYRAEPFLWHPDRDVHLCIWPT